MLAILLPLFVRRRFPFGAPVAVGVAVALSSFVDNHLIPAGLITNLAAISAFVLMGALRDRTQATAGLAFGLGVTAIVTHNDPNGGIDSFLFSGLAFAIAWTIGSLVSRKFHEAELARERAQRAEREREVRARVAVSDERARIARELHDVVGHSVSVMTVQASAVRVRLDEDQDQVRDALEVVEQTGREALAEMRRMVGVLRQPDEAPPLEPEASLEQVAGP
jgi:signal transduction histidine kinase